MMLPSAKLALVATGKENDTNLQTLSSNGLCKCRNERSLCSRKRINKSHLAHVKPLNPNKNPSFIFFTERMITGTIKTISQERKRVFPCFVCYFRQYLTDILVY